MAESDHSGSPAEQQAQPLAVMPPKDAAPPSSTADDEQQNTGSAAANATEQPAEAGRATVIDSTAAHGNTQPSQAQAGPNDSDQAKPQKKKAVPRTSAAARGAGDTKAPANAAAQFQSTANGGLIGLSSSAPHAPAWLPAGNGRNRTALPEMALPFTLPSKVPESRVTETAGSAAVVSDEDDSNASSKIGRAHV